MTCSKFKCHLWNLYLNCKYHYNCRKITYTYVSLIFWERCTKSSSLSKGVSAIKAWGCPLFIWTNIVLEVTLSSFDDIKMSFRDQNVIFVTCNWLFACWYVFVWNSCFTVNMIIIMVENWHEVFFIILVFLGDARKVQHYQTWHEVVLFSISQYRTRSQGNKISISGINIPFLWHLNEVQNFKCHL